MNPYQYQLQLLQELQKRLGSLATPEYLAELGKYRKFFGMIRETMGPMDLYRSMRECNIYKLYDEPHDYERMDASVILDGILGKHLQDLLTLVRLYQLSSGPLEQALEKHIRKAIQVFPRNSPCLDAYITELDRLVWIFTQPVEVPSPIAGATLKPEDFTARPEIPEGLSEYEVATRLLEVFRASLLYSEDFTCENFQVFLQKFGVYGNPAFGALLIPSFTEISNLLQTFYQTHDIREIINPTEFDTL